MAKSLNDILKRFEDVISGKLPPSKIETLTTGENPGVDYADKMKDGRDFVGMHTVQKHPDRNGNGDDVFKGSTTKAKMERHGHEPKPKDIQVYNKTQQQNEEYELDETSGAKAERYKKAARSKLLHLAVHTKDGPDKNRKIVNRATGMERADRAIDKDIAKKAAAQKKRLGEAKDNREYDYEGEMAVTKLKTICRHAEHLIDMMKPNTNLPEWVQSKIVKAEDYISTAHDYLMSEMNEEVEQIDEVTASINHKYVPEKWGEKSGKVKKIIDSLEKAKIPHSVAHLGGNRNSGITYVTSDHPKFASHMEKLAKKANTYDPKIYVHGVNEEVEELDESDFEKKLTKKQRARLNAAVFKASPQNPVNVEKKKRQAEKEKSDWYNSFKRPTNEEVEQIDETKKPEVSISDNVAHVKNSQGKVVASYSKKIHGSDFVKRANAHMAKLNEAKCNMTEAGTMCEVHGMKACSKEGTDSASDKEPRYNGKKKEGRQLITDKKLQEMAKSQNQAVAARIALKHKREGTMPPKGTASHSMMGMSEKQLKDYTKAEKGAPEKVVESISNQRTGRSTASEKAREKIANSLERVKMEKMKHKLKMKEQAAPAETVIRMPSGEVGDTGRV